MTESLPYRKRSPGERRAAAPHPSGFRPLSEHERAEVKALLDRGQPLPERYRHRLFAEPEGPRLIWAGKQEPAAPRAAALEVRERYGEAEQDWRNLLIQGDNGAVLAALTQPPHRRAIDAVGGLKLIYIDPPFAAQQDFPVTLAIGDQAGTASRVRVPGYADSWAGEGEAYLSLMLGRLRAMHGLLADDGFLFLHCDWRSQAALRLILDEVFGRDAFVNEIVWHYYNKYSHGQRCLPRTHDTILLYAKDPSKAGKLNPLRLPRDQPMRQLVRENVNGVLRNARGADGKLLYREVTDRKMSDVWEIPQLQPASHHWSGYPTQKHPALLERILALCTQEGDLVADFFSGSGTLPVVAQQMGRRWIACDAGAIAVHTTRKRLLDGSSKAAFDLLEVGDAEGLPLERASGASLKASAARTAEGVVVRLDGFTPEPLDMQADGAGGQSFDRLAIERGRLVRRTGARGGQADTAEILTRDWCDWIDFWAVGAVLPGTDAIAPVWHATRPHKAKGNARPLPLTAGPLRLPPEATHVTVLAVDPFGRMITRAVPAR